MRGRAKSQQIWKRGIDGELKLNIPKVINTDISFQLMFGVSECNRTQNELKNKHHNNYQKSVRTLDIKTNNDEPIKWI